MDKENKDERREGITKLDINGKKLTKKLKGSLKLTGFKNLTKLDCSNNFLTNLVLSDCPNLVDLNCSNNQFTNTNFLQSLPKKDKLKNIYLQKSIKLPNEEKIELDFLKEFKGLVELNVE